MTCVQRKITDSTTHFAFSIKIALLIKNLKILSLLLIIMKGVKMNISRRKQFLKMLAALSLAAILMIGCSENDQKDFELYSGQFKDGAVEGLKYKTETNDGLTDASGTFYYCTGETITFFVGDIQLGEPAPAKSLMTPKDLVPEDTGNPEKNKLLIARFLQTLDNDGDLDNGIQINEKVHDSAVKKDTFDPEEIIFIADENIALSQCEEKIHSALIQFHTSGVPNALTTLVDEASAQDHLNDAENEQNIIENDSADRSNNKDDQISVRRDNMGVWFINGPDNASLYDIFYEVGYQIAVDRLWQLEQYKRAATGTLSELLGSSYLTNDLFVRTLGYSQEELEAGFEGLDDESKSVIEGYVAGINQRIDYVIANRSQMPMEYVALGSQNGVDLQPSKWTVYDLLAWNVLLQRQFDPEALETDHGQLENILLLGRLMAYYSTDISSLLGQDPGTTLMGQVMFKDLRWTDDTDAQTYILDKDVPEAWKPDETPQKRMKTTYAISNIPDYSKVITNIQQFRRAVKNNLERINANVKMGSYAWVVGPEKTRDLKPIIYAGPQMGFDSPSICIECSIDAGGLKVSGMMIPGIPGVILGRTPHHAWSMQVGHVHSTDFYFDFDKTKLEFSRQEVIKVAGQEDVTIPVFKIADRPVISPLPLDPNSYTPAENDPIVSWRYSHVGHEFNMVSAMLDLARAESIAEFSEGITKLGLSQHFCYADRDGNIAYWMSGRDPVRPDDPLGLGYQLPQGFKPSDVPQMDWDDDVLKPRSHLVNPTRHYFAGWNNKSHPYYSGSPNNVDYFTGPFHRSHILYEYLDNHNDLTYEDVRDLAISISTTESIGKAGNPWTFVKDIFSDAVAANPSDERTNALAILNAWDGHFVDGGKAKWASGMDRSDGWMLMDKWVRKVIEKTFSQYLPVFSKADSSDGSSGAEGDDEANLLFGNEYQRRLLNVIIRSFKGKCNYDWFNNTLLTPAPESAQAMKAKAFSYIVEALDETLAELGVQPWGVAQRGYIEISNGVLSILVGEAIPGWKIWRIPFGSRSTYAQCVQFDSNGPDRIESFFPLGQSTQIYWSILLSSDVNRFLKPHETHFYHEHFFDMSTKYFDKFIHREFPLFSK
jgi:penicillin amidase